MKKLTDAAGLYLSNYYALKIAEEEVNRYLDSVLEQIFNLIKTEITSYKSDFYIWETDINEKREGRFEISPIFNESVGIFEKNRKMISVLYKDVRDYKHFNNTNSVRISIYCRKNLRESFLTIPKENLFLSLNKAEQLGVPLDLESPIPAIYTAVIDIDPSDELKTVKAIAEEVLKVQRGLEAFLNCLIKKK